MKTQKEILKSVVTLMLGFVFAFSIPLISVASDIDGWEEGGSFSGWDTGSAYDGWDSGSAYDGWDTGGYYDSWDSGSAYDGWDSGSAYDGWDSGSAYDGWDTGGYYDSWDSGSAYDGWDSGSAYSGWDDGSAFVESTGQWYDIAEPVQSGQWYDIAEPVQSGQWYDIAQPVAFSQNITPFSQIATGGGYSASGYSTGGYSYRSAPQPPVYQPQPPRVQPPVYQPPRPTPVPTPIPQPIPTPRPVPTPIPTPVPTPVPTPIPTPVPYPYPVPVPQIPTPSQLSCDMRIQSNGNFVSIYYIMSSQTVSAYINNIGAVPVAVGQPGFKNVYPPYASAYIMTVRGAQGQTANCYASVPQIPVYQPYPQPYPIVQPGVNVSASTYNPGVTYDYVTISDVPYTGPADASYVLTMLALALGIAFAVFHFRRVFMPLFTSVTKHTNEPVFLSETIVAEPADEVAQKKLTLKVENGYPKLTFI